MPYSTAGRNLMLDALRTGALATPVAFVSAHTADPADTGANEVAGGTPAYARQAITFNAAAAGSLDSSNTPTFDIPAGTTVAWIGYWSAATGGVFLGSSDVVDEVFAGQGTYEVSDADLDLNLT